LLDTFFLNQGFDQLAHFVAATIGVILVIAFAFSIYHRKTFLASSAQAEAFPKKLMMLAVMLTLASIFAISFNHLQLQSLLADNPDADNLNSFAGRVRQNSQNGLYIVLTGIMMLMASWFFALRTIHIWQNQQEDLYDQIQTNLADLEASREEALQAKKVAESANLAKSDFLANMSHEIRTPMNGVLGMARLLLDTNLDEEQRNWTDIIRRSGENLMGIINDILDISKIEAGKLVLEQHPFNLQNAVMEVTNVLIVRALEKNIELQVRFSPEVPTLLVGDAMRFKQVLLNLVGNALKFTEYGHVLLSFRSLGENENKVRLYVEVEDTGVGISQEKTRYIFEKFSQGEESTTRKFGGTGLGLAICKHLVTLMQGHINVVSAPGKGSVFHFDGVFGTIADRRKKLVPDVALEKLRVLSLAAYPLNRTIKEKYFSMWGMQAHFCISLNEVETALEKAQDDGAPYDFLIMEHKTSQLQFYECLHRIRSNPSYADLGILITTSLSVAIGLREKTEKYVQAILNKPVFPDLLQAALRLICDARINRKKIALITPQSIANLQNGENVKGNARKTFPGLRVLVAEDLKINLMLITTVLERLGCIVENAENGVIAVEKAKASHYDIIFMDCQMPEMDGFEATRVIRNITKAGSCYTPIIALTADAMIGDREKCLSAGMDDYINKPFTPEQITSILKTWCGIAA
jgi:signal transduction histidine kinase/CheY-like chemotaxis protein